MLGQGGGIGMPMVNLSAGPVLSLGVARDMERKKRLPT